MIGNRAMGSITSNKRQSNHSMRLGVVTGIKRRDRGEKMKIIVNSQVRGYQKFMADKNIHSWCGTGSESPIPTAGVADKFKAVERARGDGGEPMKPAVVRMPSYLRRGRPLE